MAEAPAEAAEEDDGQPQQTFDARDLLKEGDPDTDFMKWYRTEKAIEEYKKNNPTNAIEEATRKLAGPLSTLAVIGFGFYVIPVVKGIVTGVQEAADEGSNPALSVLGNVASRRTRRRASARSRVGERERQAQRQPAQLRILRRRRRRRRGGGARRRRAADHPERRRGFGVDGKK